MYGKKGEQIVRMNQEAVDKGIEAVHEISIPENWIDATDDKEYMANEPEFISKIVRFLA